MSAVKTPKRKDPEALQVALRFEALRTALGMTQDEFAKASKTLERSQVNQACNGNTLAKTEKWSQGVANAVGVDEPAARAYIRGRMTMVDLLALRDAIGTGPAQPTTESERVLANFTRVAKLRGFTAQEAQLASDSVRGRDGTASLSEAQIVEILERVRATIRDVGRIIRDVASAPVADSGGSALDDLGPGTKAQRPKRR